MKQTAALVAARDLTVQAFRTMEEVTLNAFNNLIAAFQQEPEPVLDDRYLPTQAAADYLGMPIGSLHKLMHRNAISYIRPGKGKAYFKKSDLDAFMSRGRIPSNDELMGRG
jgi:excisionase family DNA binding protein